MRPLSIRPVPGFAPGWLRTSYLFLLTGFRFSMNAAMP